MRNQGQDLSGSKFWVGFVIGAIAIAGCATASFPYKFYKPNLEHYDGYLLGAKPSDDLPGSICLQGTTGTEGANCVVMLRDAFFQMKADYLKTKQDLIDLQKKCQE